MQFVNLIGPLNKSKGLFCLYQGLEPWRPRDPTEPQFKPCIYKSPRRHILYLVTSLDLSSNKVFYLVQYRIHFTYKAKLHNNIRQMHPKIKSFHPFCWDSLLRNRLDRHNCFGDHWEKSELFVNLYLYGTKHFPSLWRNPPDSELSWFSQEIW